MYLQLENLVNDLLYITNPKVQKEKDLEKLENNMNSIQNLVLSLDLKVNNLKNQIDILMTQKFDNNKINNDKKNNKEDKSFTSNKTYIKNQKILLRKKRN